MTADSHNGFTGSLHSYWNRCSRHEGKQHIRLSDAHSFSRGGGGGVGVGGGGGGGGGVGVGGGGGV
ncbi:hypothetical protein, partial [Edaphobacter acidisoli]|uniref:hypothetical protein n=1 Tax=Edaphobacter acidisoli TaxID=2040573 RepID=UPI0016653ADA